jgi:hypothetical protein
MQPYMLCFRNEHILQHGRMLGRTNGKHTIIRELKHVSLPRSAATPQRHQQPVYTRVESHVVSVGIVIK